MKRAVGFLAFFVLLGAAIWAGIDPDEPERRVQIAAGPTPSPRRVPLPEIPKEYRGHWEVTFGKGSLGPLPRVKDGKANLKIGPKKVHGFTGCNSLAGPIRIDDTSFDAAGIGHSEAGCPSDTHARLEERFVVALHTIERIRRRADVLILTGPQTELRLRFVPPLPRVPLIGTKWHIDGLAWGDGTVQSAQGAWFELRADRTFVAYTGCRRLTATWAAEGDAAHIADFEAVGDCTGGRQQDGFLIEVFRNGFSADLGRREVKVEALVGKRGLYAQARTGKRQ